MRISEARIKTVVDGRLWYLVEHALCDDARCSEVFHEPQAQVVDVLVDQLPDRFESRHVGGRGAG